MTGKIFINYRRGDDPGHTGRLFDRLQETFAPEQLFLDVDNIAPGLDFVRVIEERVAECDVMLAVIGKSWTDARDAAGNRRLALPDDFVRIEIASALNQNKRVIPILVGEAQMPRADELPEELRPLVRRNAVRLTHERFRVDTQSLIKALQSALAEFDLMREGQGKSSAQVSQAAQMAPEPAAARNAAHESAPRRRPLWPAAAGAGAVAVVVVGAAAVFWSKSAPSPAPAAPTFTAAQEAPAPAAAASPPSTGQPNVPVVAQAAASPPANANNQQYPPARTRTVKRDVSLGYLNMRAGPGLDQKVVARIPAGATGVVIDGLCIPTKDVAYPFCLVEWNGLQGWVSSNGLE